MYPWQQKLTCLKYQYWVVPISLRVQPDLTGSCNAVGNPLRSLSLRWVAFPREKELVEFRHYQSGESQG